MLRLRARGDDGHWLGVWPARRLLHGYWRRICPCLIFLCPTWLHRNGRVGGSYLRADGGDRLIQFLRFAGRCDHPFQFLAQARVFGIKYNQRALQIFIADKGFALQAPYGLRFIVVDAAAVAALEQEGAEFIDIGAGQRTKAPDGLLNGPVVIEIGQPQIVVGAAAGGLLLDIGILGGIADISGWSSVTRCPLPGPAQVLHPSP